ncbi:MAG TPA: MarR family transcriptional regulator [Streptosporangiaceae bacterium]|nr:MarR family transcriptional regulator [Streptosporangiaceae bacterium]
MQNDRWEAALDQVLLLTVLLGRDMTESLARMGLTEARAHLVWELQARGPCTQRALASALHVTPRAITALVDSLVETGFVTREPCPADRRAILVTFTELGRTTGQALADGHRELARHLFAGMPAEAFDGFEGSLSHVVDRLRTLLAKPAHDGLDSSPDGPTGGDRSSPGNGEIAGSSPDSRPGTGGPG